MEVEKGVPFPTQSVRVSKYKFPLGEMEIGDSFYVEVKTEGFLNTARSLISRYGKVFNRKFATRMMDGGFRVWRIE
ncbi:hypothetical protein UFOVP95_50 [uncultured Caudovirales phage]|uniref:Uncharacterized protein n=1 Tax=uncultured Caudovirales phage TaxID=2100421 RepID=A0A6J5KYH3_9CAUD|nr:hypothetical protein UFOVP95_50 [uncultured Caudovirales phage]